MEGAAAGGASREAQAVRRGGVGDAVDGRHRVPLRAGRHSDAAEEEEEEGEALGWKPRWLRVSPLQASHGLVSTRV